MTEFIEELSEEIAPPTKLVIARERLTRWLARAERDYLVILRVAFLILASLLLLGATWLLGSGIFKQFGSTTVVADPVAITATDIAPARMSKVDAEAEKTPSTPEGAPADAVRRANQIYRARFAPFQRAGDRTPDAKMIGKTVWDENLISRLDAIDLSLLQGSDGEPATTVNRNTMMLELIDKASLEPGMQRQLKAYRTASKVRVCNDEVRSRKRTISDWDASATWCAGWYLSPYGCPGEREVTEPFIENVCAMKFPEDLANPLGLMEQSADRFVDVAETRIQQAQLDASEERSQIIERKAEGKNSVVDSGKLFLVFLALMFLYLLVIIERHYQGMAVWFRRNSKGVD